MAAIEIRRGIRQRENGNYVVEVVIDGKRKPKTFKKDRFADAVAYKEAHKAGRALPVPPKIEAKMPCWTLSKAIDVAFATERTERVPGFKGNKANVTPKTRLEIVTRYFGETFPISELRRDTEDERVRREAGYGESLPRTLDGLISALRDGKSLNLQPNANASINRTLSVLHKTLVLAKHKNGLRELPDWPGHLREPKWKIRYFSDEEEAEIFRWCDTYENSGHGGVRAIEGAEWFRDMMIVLVDTGMRWGEFKALERSDPDFRLNIVLVHGVDDLGTKNGEHRSVPMTSRVAEVMRRRIAAKDFPFQPVYMTCWWMFNKMKEDIGLGDDKRFTIHTARHTCASRLVQRGVDILVVKEWLGHKTLATTQRYAHLNPKNLRNAAAVLEPAQAAPSAEDQIAAFVKEHGLAALLQAAGAASGKEAAA